MLPLFRPHSFPPFLWVRPETGLAWNVNHRGAASGAGDEDVDTVLLTDTLRAGHLLGLAMGMGLAFGADLLALRMIFKPVSERDFWLFYRLHGIIAISLGLLWVTGLGLLYVRTGLDPANVTPKLLVKLGVVGLLTINAMAVGTFVLPCLARNIGYRFGDMEAKEILRLSTIAGVSMSCWLSALALGVFTRLKPMSFQALADVFAPIFVFGFTAAIVMGLFAVVVIRSGPAALFRVRA